MKIRDRRNPNLVHVAPRAHFYALLIDAAWHLLCRAVLIADDRAQVKYSRLVQYLIRRSKRPAQPGTTAPPLIIVDETTGIPPELIEAVRSHPTHISKVIHIGAPDHEQ